MKLHYIVKRKKGVLNSNGFSEYSNLDDVMVFTHPINALLYIKEKFAVDGVEYKISDELQYIYAIDEIHANHFATIHVVKEITQHFKTEEEESYEW